MIVVDIECSGVNFLKNGICQIGAIEIYSKEKFFGECRIDDTDEVTAEALQVMGTTEKHLRDKSKQSQKQLLEKFFEWCKKSKIKNFVCQGPQLDAAYLRSKAAKYNLKYPVHWRAFDLHSIASFKYKQLHGKFPLKEDHSDMSLTNIIKFCGIIHERGAHNALEDAMLTAECFSRIVNGKNLLKEYKKYAVPKYLNIKKIR